MRRRLSVSPADPRLPALFLSAEAPYPPEGGGALRSASLLAYLARSRDVDAIVFRQPDAPDPVREFPAGIARRVFVIDLPPNRRGFAARAWRNAGRVARLAPPLMDRFAGFGREVEEAIGGRRYGVGVIEHFWCAPYHRRIAGACAETVLDLHNVESVLHARCARTEGGAAAFAHNVFRHACVDLERYWLPRFTRVLAASENDSDLVRGIAPSACVTVYRNSLPLVPLPPRTGEQAIVFSGNMGYHPNISAVRFFRREVWPVLRERCPALVWRLVGKNPGAVQRYVEGDSRIEMCGPVKDAIAELAKARVAVVPVLAGSGTRFKILEAWAAGIPVISTTLGAEGLPARDGENILLADSGAAFAEAVLRLLACSDIREQLGMAGRRLLEQECTWENAWKSLDF
jgi:polysaccharide biosynthesis protein PslH